MLSNCKGRKLIFFELIKIKGKLQKEKNQLYSFGGLNLKKNCLRVFKICASFQIEFNPCTGILNVGLHRKSPSHGCQEFPLLGKTVVGPWGVSVLHKAVSRRCQAADVGLKKCPYDTWSLATKWANSHCCFLSCVRRKKKSQLKEPSSQEASPKQATAGLACWGPSSLQHKQRVTMVNAYGW